MENADPFVHKKQTDADIAVSIVMPAYNAEKTVALSVTSVLNQTFTDFELVIIDDCSSDETFAVCNVFAMSDARVRVSKNVINLGVAETRNKGVSEARGKWVAFIDSDDLWLPDKLEKQMLFLNKTGGAISYTASAFISADGSNYNYVLHAEPKLTYKMLLRRNLMSCSSVVVCRDVMLRTPFRAGILHEDYAAWLEIVRVTGVAFGLDEPLLIYRVSKASKSGRRLRSGMMVYQTYRAVGYSSIRSWIMTLVYARHSLGKRVKLCLSIIK